MRIGLVVYDGLDRTTGGYLYDRKLVERWRERGHEVAVVGIPGGSYARELLDNLDRRLGATLSDLPVDVLVEDELCHPSLVGHNRRLRDGPPVVALVHHLRSSEPHPPVRRRVYEAVERRYLHTADAFVFNSRATRDSVTDRVGAVPGVVAPPAGDRFGAAVDGDRIDARAREPGPLRVAFVGSLTPRKGADVLVRAVSRAAGRGAAVTATLVGDPGADPAHARRVRRLAGALGVDDRVTFAGRLPDGDLAAHLRESHVLAVPSTYEGFGIVYLEGMGFGLPAVASAAGGAREVVADGETGFLVPPGDAGAVADRLATLAADRDRLAEMGRAARSAFDAHPSWAETADRVARFLRSVADREGRRC